MSYNHRHVVTETAAQGGMKGWHIAMIVFSCLLILLVVGLVIALLVKKKGGTFTSRRYCIVNCCNNVLLILYREITIPYLSHLL